MASPNIGRDCLSSNQQKGAAPVRINLTQGYFALVSASDYELVASYKWCVTYSKDKYRKRIKYYAATYLTKKGVRSKIYMHRLIMRARKGRVIDHIDSNGLNNQRENLRSCSHKQNSANISVDEPDVFDIAIAEGSF